MPESDRRPADPSQTASGGATEPASFSPTGRLENPSSAEIPSEPLIGQHEPGAGGEVVLAPAYYYYDATLYEAAVDETREYAAPGYYYYDPAEYRGGSDWPHAGLPFPHFIYLPPAEEQPPPAEIQPEQVATAETQTPALDRETEHPAKVAETLLPETPVLARHEATIEVLPAELPETRSTAPVVPEEKQRPAAIPEPALDIGSGETNRIESAVSPAAASEITGIDEAPPTAEISLPKIESEHSPETTSPPQSRGISLPKPPAIWFPLGPKPASNPAPAPAHERIQESEHAPAAAESVVVTLPPPVPESEAEPAAARVSEPEPTAALVPERVIVAESAPEPTLSSSPATDLLESAPPAGTDLGSNRVILPEQEVHSPLLTVPRKEIASEIESKATSESKAQPSSSLVSHEPESLPTAAPEAQAPPAPEIVREPEVSLGLAPIAEPADQPASEPEHATEPEPQFEPEILPVASPAAVTIPAPPTLDLEAAPSTRPDIVSTPERSAEPESFIAPASQVEVLIPPTSEPASPPAPTDLIAPLSPLPLETTHKPEPAKVLAAEPSREFKPGVPLALAASITPALESQPAFRTETAPVSVPVAKTAREPESQFPLPSRPAPEPLVPTPPQPVPAAELELKSAANPGIVSAPAAGLKPPASPERKSLPKPVPAVLPGRKLEAPTAPSPESAPATAPASESRPATLSSPENVIATPFAAVPMQGRAFGVRKGSFTLKVPGSEVPKRAFPPPVEPKPPVKPSPPVPSPAIEAKQQAPAPATPPVPAEKKPPAAPPPTVEKTAPAPVPTPIRPPKSEAIPAAFQPRFAPDAGPVPGRFSVAILILTALACLAAGLALGYYLPKSAEPGGKRKAGNKSGMASRSRDDDSKVPPTGLTATEQTDLDAAFTASKLGNFDESIKLFTALQSKHPEWGSMAIEIGRLWLYKHDVTTAHDVLTATIAKEVMPGDANFLLGLLYMTNLNFTEAESSFANAVVIDPARPDFFYFWGECLRREGKPLEAAGRFRSAMLRNQYETADGLYRLKYWLSKIQVDQENTDGITEQIDKSLELPRPPMEALFASAARAIKAGKIDVAANSIRRARLYVEPTVYGVIIQDPTFLQENWRPELAEFFKPLAAAPPVSLNGSNAADSAPAPEVMPAPSRAAASPAKSR